VFSIISKRCWAWVLAASSDSCFYQEISVNRAIWHSRCILTMLSSRCSLPSFIRASCHDVSLSSPAARCVSLKRSWGDRAAKEETLSCGRNVLGETDKRSENAMGRKVQTKDFRPERWARPSAEWCLCLTQICRWAWKSWLLSLLSSYDGWRDSVFLVVLWVQSQCILSLFQSWGNSWFRLPALRPIEVSVSEVMIMGEGKRYIRLVESWVLGKEHKQYYFSRYH